MKSSIVSILLLVLLAGSGAFLIGGQNSLSQLSNELALSNSKRDSLSRESERLNARMILLKKRADSLAEKDNTLFVSLTKSKSLLFDEEKSIRKLNSEFVEMNKKCDFLLDRQKQEYRQMNLLASNNVKIGGENKELTAKLARLIEANNQLLAELSFAKQLEKDSIFIESRDKNDELCFFGNKIKKILITMCVSSDIKSPALKIFDPQGRPLPERAGQLTFSTSAINSFSKNLSKLKLTYLLTEKIDSGPYRMEIANNGKHIGTLLMKFR
jgi:hypothetical protein